MQMRESPRTSLAGRVFVTLLAISIVSATLALAASVFIHQSTIMSDAMTELHNECDVVASTLDAADDEVAELDTIELGEMRATLVTPDGEVLYDSLVAPTSLVAHASRPEIASALKTGRGTSVRASDTLGNVSIYQARLLESGNVLRLSVDRAGALSILMGDLGVLGIVFLALVLLSWIASRVLSTRLVKPILELDTSPMSSLAPYDELQPLTDRLTEQQAELLSQMEDLKHADVMRREFTANVTHELKTPIASIMGASELLRDGFVLEEDVPDFAARINAESQRLSALVSDILTLSRLDESERARSQDLFGTAETVNLLAVCKDVYERMVARAENAGVSLFVEGEPASIVGYPRIVDELVANLCSNAIRYNKPGGEVRMVVSIPEGIPTLTVSDTGIGIPKASQPKVFERFYRVETSRSRASGGTGLGLAIVKHAAMLHGADLFLESELGEGTVVTVRFSANAL